MKKVAIILATYNGERYLSEQLESLRKQTYKNIKVYIHDDGSSDKTLDIIKEYVEHKRGTIDFELYKECKVYRPQKAYRCEIFTSGNVIRRRSYGNDFSI